MNAKQARQLANASGIEVTGDHELNGKKYFCVCDTTNDEAVIVDRVGRASWRPEGATANHTRTAAILVAFNALLSRRNK